MADGSWHMDDAHEPYAISPLPSAMTRYCYDQKSYCTPNFTSRASNVEVGRSQVAPFVP